MFVHLLIIKLLVGFSVSFVSAAVINPESIEKCSGVNIFGSDDSIFYYIRSLKYLQHSVLIENLSGMRTGLGLGISWNKYPYEDSNYALQIRFKHYLVICCVGLNPNMTNVREYEVKLLDKSGAYIIPTQVSVDPTKFAANANLFVDMSRNTMGAYGIELNIKRTQGLNEPPANVELTVVLCEKTANVSEKLRQQQHSAQTRLRDAQLFEYCSSDDQCDRLILGAARCVNSTCQCEYGGEIDKYRCPVTSLPNVEDLSFASENINYNALTRSKNRTMRFIELSRIDCQQDKDCETSFSDSNMMCINTRCVCSIGYRLVQDPADSNIKCVKSRGGSVLKYPTGCEIPACEFILYLFVFELGTSGQRLVSVVFVTDHRFYIREYYQIVFNEDKIKFLVDADDNMRVVLDDRFYKLYRNLTLQDGYKIRTSRDVNNEDGSQSRAQRRPRYVLHSLTNTSNITKETSNDVIIQYDEEEYKFFNYYINAWYMDAGNLTSYVLDFNSNFSALILQDMFLTAPSGGSGSGGSSSTTPKNPSNTATDFSTPPNSPPSFSTTTTQAPDYEDYEDVQPPVVPVSTPNSSVATSVSQLSSFSSQMSTSTTKPILPTFDLMSCLLFKLVRGNFVQMTPSASTPSKQPFFFESKHITRLPGFLFCLNLNTTNNSTTTTTNSQCKNGVALYESRYPIASALLNQTKYTCHCWTGYWGPQCDSVNPCYTMVYNSTRMTNNMTSNGSSEPVPILTKFCQNDGMCLATKSSALFYYVSGIKYLAYCLCRPQFAGKSCERNLDGCTYPFIYKETFHNRCVINQKSGLPFCARGVLSLDESPANATACVNIPCKTPWKYHGSVSNYNRCVYKQYRDEKGIYESPICSLTRNYELFRTWRFCERVDFP